VPSASTGTTIRSPHAGTRGKFRFDVPRGEFSVTYAWSDELGCFAEVFGDRRLIEDADGDRYVFRLVSQRPLRLLRLDDGDTLMSLGLDARVCTIKPYRRTQLWSRAFYDWYPRLDGLRYVPRYATGHTNYCLYLDRCAGVLVAESQGRIATRHDLLERVIDAYPLTTTLL